MKKIFLVLCCIALFYNMMSQNEDMKQDWNCVPPIIPSHNYEYMYFQRNDSIFFMRIYPSKMITDSIICNFSALKISFSKWITPRNEDGAYSIIRFVKKTHSAWFKKNNGKLFQANFECKPSGTSKSYSPDGSILIYRPFLIWVRIKRIWPKENKYNLHVPP